MSLKKLDDSWSKIVTFCQKYCENDQNKLKETCENNISVKGRKKKLTSITLKLGRVKDQYSTNIYSSVYN